jgi:hypothetical protein
MKVRKYFYCSSPDSFLHKTLTPISELAVELNGGKICKVCYELGWRLKMKPVPYKTTLKDK